MKFDYRGGRRLHLKRPAPAMITGGRADILDISLVSAGIEHDFPIERGSQIFLEFSWGTRVMTLTCNVVRTRALKFPAGRYRSGLRVIRKRSPSIIEYTRRVTAALEKLKQEEAKKPPLV